MTKARSWRTPICVAPGIYKDPRTGNLYERPVINGRRTFRKLKNTTVKFAREELAARRTDHARSSYGTARDPYTFKPVATSYLLDLWEAAGCPDRHGPSEGRKLYNHQNRIEKLKPFWGKRQAHTIKARDCVDYFNHRRRQIKRNHGGRAVDLELSTLSSAFRWSVMAGKLESNPILTRQKFRQRTIRHCRDTMPEDASELHALAAALFVNPMSQALGWQLLMEAMTGCRTSEILRLRVDAKPRRAGYIDGDWLWLERSKGGVNPFVQIHPALRKALAALDQWRKVRKITNPYLIPGKLKGHPLNRDSLTHALKKIAPSIAGGPRTSHGLRAYYVTARRSQGISDAQIAAEIGDKSGASIIASTYGAIPPNWQGSPGLTWMSKKPAWEVIPGMPAGMPRKTANRRTSKKPKKMAHPSGVEPETF